MFLIFQIACGILLFLFIIVVLERIFCGKYISNGPYKSNSDED